MRRIPLIINSGKAVRKMRQRRAATQHRESTLRHIRAVVLGQDSVGKSGKSEKIV